MNPSRDGGAGAEADGAAANELLDAIAQLAFTVMGVLSAAASANELSLTQFRAIAILRDRRLRMSELARVLGLEKSTLSGLVLRAEARGLLQRVPDEGDRRAALVTIAPAGEALAREVRSSVSDALAPLIGQLAGAEQRELQRLVERMLDGGAQLPRVTPS